MSAKLKPKLELKLKLFLILGLCALPYSCCPAQTVTKTSYYGQECANKPTASGQLFDPAKFTCASWDYKLGTKLKVTNPANHKSVIVIVNDRGPAKRLVAQGRTLDLSEAAFSAIANKKLGVIKIQIEIVR